MDKTILAWLILRIGYAWLYLYALKMLFADWSATEWVVGLVFPCCIRLFAILCVLSMILSSVMLIFGIYAQVAGVILFFYNLIGACIHYRIAAVIKAEQQVEMSNKNDQDIFKKVQALGIGGHVTSAQKNFILAAVALFFMLMGSGPWSVTNLLW